MKVIVQAIKRTDIYEVYQVENNVFYSNKPILTLNTGDCEEEIVTIKELEVNENHILLNTMNYDDILITDYKGNKVDGEFRIQYDLLEDTVYLKSDVIVELLEPNRDEMEKELEERLKVWNKETIEKDQRLNAYCELHKLDKETIDISMIKKLLPKNDKLDGLTYATGGIVLSADVCRNIGRPISFQ